jgi:hypothetical protein
MAFGQSFWGVDVVQTWLLFAGVAYALIGIFNCLMAKRLRDANIPSANRNAIAYPNGERERLRELDNRTSATIQRRLENKEISQAEAQYYTDGMKWGHFFLNIDGVLENLNNSFDYFDRFVAEFNKATKLNRCVLYGAAVSFFLAAAISFAQGLSII